VYDTENRKTKIDAGGSKKLTIRDLDQVNHLGKDMQKDAKTGANNYLSGITRHPIYCSSEPSSR
jgi:hypothetical protein